MKTTSALAVLAAVTACCPDVPNDRLEIVGTPPLNAEVVIAVAEERCGRPVVGRLEWLDASRDGEHTGYCSWDGSGCPMEAWVVRRQVPRETRCWTTPDDLAVTCTMLAHEIGHWCLRSEDEAEVEAWAREVNDAVRSAID